MAGNWLVYCASSWRIYKKLSAVIYLFHFGAYFCCLGFNLRLVNQGFWGNSNGTWTRQYVQHSLQSIYKMHIILCPLNWTININFGRWTFTTLITRVFFHSILTLSGTVFLFQIRIKCDSKFYDWWFKQNCISIPKRLLDPKLHQIFKPIRKFPCTFLLI